MTENSSLGQTKQEEIVSKFQGMRLELQKLASKVGEFEVERDEHKLVIDSISELENERKCFRLINGILVEMTVGNVKPILQQNVENLTKLLNNFLETYKEKEKEMLQFQEKWKIKIS
jgi:prefoldin subunit 2